MSHMSNLDRVAGSAFRPRASARSERGMSLIELLVGISIGLLVIAAALGTLVLSKGAATSVSEVSQLQQQGSYALRVIGNQFRQAGSVEVLLTPASLYAFDNQFLGFSGGATAVMGSDGAGTASDEVSVSNQAPIATGLTTLQRDCIGTTVNDGVRIDSTFYVDAANNQLYCKGKASAAQPIADNVADFQVRYRISSAAGVRSMTASEVTAASAWPSVSAIEVCIDMQGVDSSSPTSGNYETCQRDSAGAAISASRAGRLHLVFRNVFDLRTQGAF